MRVRPGALPELGTGEVQVFWLRTTGEKAQLAFAMQMLSAEERDRAKRYLVEGARLEFAVGRAALRMLLGAALGVEAAEVDLQTDQYRKPFARGIEFNVSHSRGLICIALSRETAVGVDVEWVDPALEAMDLAEANFTVAEARSLAAVADGVERAAAFCRIWTLKEAVAKADGRGLGIALANIALPDSLPGPAVVPADSEGKSVVTRQELPDGSMTYRVYQLKAEAGYVAALSVRDSKSPTVCRSFLLDLAPSGVS